MRITLFGLAAIAIIGAIIVFVGPLFISTDDLRNSLFAQVEFDDRLSPARQRSGADLAVPVAGSGRGGCRHRQKRCGGDVRDGDGQIAALRLAAVGVDRRQGQNDRGDADRSCYRRAANAAGRQERGGCGSAAGGPGSAAASLRSLSLDKLLIKNGTLILPGSAGAPGKRIEALNLEASMPAPDATLAFDGSASLDGQKIQVAGSIGGLAQLLDGKAVPVSFDIAAPSYLEREGRSDRRSPATRTAASSSANSPRGPATNPWPAAAATKAACSRSTR